MSATFRTFVDKALGARVGAATGVALIDGTYTFNAAHVSFAADVLPHVVAGLTLTQDFSRADAVGGSPLLPLPWGFDSSPDLFFQQLDQGQGGVPGPFNEGWAGGFSNAPGGGFVPEGVTVKAVVIHDTAPLLYLDEETFPGLPQATLGGAVEMYWLTRLLIGLGT